MLRDLNLNEMEIVSGGFANDELPTGGIELWDKDSDRSGSGIVPEGGDHSAIITNTLWTVQSSNLSQVTQTRPNIFDFILCSLVTVPCVPEIEGK